MKHRIVDTERREEIGRHSGDGCVVVIITWIGIGTLVVLGIVALV